MNPLKHLGNLALTALLFLTVTQESFAQLRNTDAERIISAGTERLDLRVDRKAVDRIKKGLYRLRSKLEKTELEERRSVLVDAFNFEVSKEQLQAQLDSSLAIGELSPEEGRIAQRFISEFDRTAKIARELDPSDVIPFVDQMIHETEQANIFAIVGTSYFLYIFDILPGIALIGAIGMGICQLFQIDDSCN